MWKGALTGGRIGCVIFCNAVRCQFCMWVQEIGLGGKHSVFLDLDSRQLGMWLERFVIIVTSLHETCRRLGGGQCRARRFSISVLPARIKKGFFVDLIYLFGCGLYRVFFSDVRVRERVWALRGSACTAINRI